MSLLQLLFAVIATAVLIGLVQYNKIPPPFHWVVYIVVVVVWVYILLLVTGVLSDLGTTRIGAA